MKKLVALMMMTILVFAGCSNAVESSKAEETTEEPTVETTSAFKNSVKDETLEINNMRILSPQGWEYSKKNDGDNALLIIRGESGATVSCVSFVGTISQGKEHVKKLINNLYPDTGAISDDDFFSDWILDGCPAEYLPVKILSKNSTYAMVSAYVADDGEYIYIILSIFPTGYPQAVTDGETINDNILKSIQLKNTTNNQNTTVFQNSMPTEKPTEKSTEKPTEKPAQLLFQNNGIKITYTGITYSYGRTEINVKIENNSGKDYIVQTRDESVNGYMISPVFSCEVTNGKIANDKITFYNSALERNEIKHIENVELSFHVFNDEDFKDRFDTEKISFNP